MKRTLSTVILAGTLAVTAAGASPLTISDYCDIPTATPKRIKEMRPLADGLSYTAISDDGKAIEVFSYKTGQKTSTLFNVDAVKGDIKISDFEGYSISQNEKKILLWNSSKQVYRYSFFAEYYVYDILRGTLKRVSANGAQRGAVLSHDGRMVAFQRDNNVFITNLDYDTEVAVTKDGKINEIIYGTPDWAYEEEFGVQNTICWSPDDNVLAFMRFDEREVPVYSFDDYRSYCDKDPLGDPYPNTFSYKYPLPGYNNSVVDVLAYEVDNRKIKTMDIPKVASDYIPVLQFAQGDPQNRLLAMVLNRDQNSLKLYTVNPGSTVATMIYTDTSTAWLSPSAYQMGVFGKDSFIIGSDKTGYRHLYQYDYNGNLKRQLTSGEYNVTSYYGKDAQGAHYIQCTKLGAINRNVAKVDAKGNVTLLNGVAGTERASFSANCEYYVRSYSNATTPWQYTVCNNKGAKLADLELNAAYAARYADAPQKEFLKMRNADGQEMDAYILKPKNFDPNKKYPLLMYQYNGPESQQVLNSWSIDGLYYFAQEGVLIGCVDGRGTGCRNRQWSDAVYKRLGYYETKDQIAGAKEFGNLPYVDEKRLACFGWSYGGYMTLMEMTSPDSPFKCGVSMAPVTDWRFYDSIYTERFMLTPGQNESGYEAASAINRTKQLSGRLLIMHGTSDDNVHFYNTLKFTSKLNYEGKIFDMMALTGFEHSLRMCNARTMLYSKIFDFLKTNL